ncbi:hypothetical protein U9R90_10830 [Streptomyces sp. E11-3]|uniref:hypothetical protein n=1 Tax=Streptomyces sp. E11-3 TaxID=3110112 RepID=UPI00397FA81B
MRTPVEFVPADGEVREAVTKAGGQPVWLAEPQWPLTFDGEPMDFFGQFALEGGRLAYLFLTDEGDEHALVLQPGGRIPDSVTVRAQAAGPTVGEDHLPRSGEPLGDDDAWQFFGGPGVEPRWLQGDETPDDGWDLVAQLDSGDLPFFVNFGDAGVGYAFVSPDGREGCFLWQCC